jgi:hypothetical protein
MPKKKINPTSRTRTIELDGKQYTVEYAGAAYDAMYQLTGVSLLKGWENEWDMREYTCFLYAGLLKHQADITLDFCYDALNGATLTEIQDDLFAAYRASMPKPKDEPANPSKPIAKS